MDTSKLKPFNLERALAGDPVVTRDGRPVKIAGHNPDANPRAAVCGWISEVVRQWDSKGKYYDHNLHRDTPSIQCNCDLFMAPKTRTVWVSLYQGGNDYLTYWKQFDTEKEADDYDYRFRGSFHRFNKRSHPIEIEE